MFVAFSKVFTPENLLYFAKGAVVSLLLAAVSLLFGIVFGILGSSAKRSKYKIFRIIGNVYVEVIRGTPMLLQILILFSVIPSIYTAFTGNVLRINVFLIDLLIFPVVLAAIDFLRLGFLIPNFMFIPHSFFYKL